MKRRKTIILVIILVILWLIMFGIDYVRVKEEKLPIFCIESAHVADGGTTIYMGLGYKVINYNIKTYSDEGAVYKGTFIGSWFMKYEDYNQIVLKNSNV